MAGRRFQFIGGTSSKFWTIFPPEQADKDNWQVSVKYGRIGTPGTDYSKVFYSKYGALGYYNSKILEKRNKGYIELSTPVLKPATVSPASLPWTPTTVQPFPTFPNVAGTWAPCQHNTLNRSGMKWKCANCKSEVEFDKQEANEPAFTPEVTQQKVRRFMDLSMLRKE